MALEAASVPTKGEAAYDALRRAILENRLHPGERVTLQGLAAELGMSLTPVREALRLLAAQGLVIQQPNRETRIAEYTRERAEEIYRLRRVLEPMATERAAVRIDDAGRAEVRAALADYAETMKAGRHDLLADLNVRVHRSIYLASGSSFLVEFIDRLWGGIPFDVMSVSRHPARSHRDHKKIVAAVCKGERELAGRLMRQHIVENTAETIRRYPSADDPPADA